MPNQRSSAFPVNTSPAGEQAETKDPRHRAQSLKQHTSLEAWSTVSSHDSEEYDTDLDEKSTTAGNFFQYQ